MFLLKIGFTKLPKMGFEISHPFVLGLEHLLDDVADAAFSAFFVADIQADVFYLVRGIGGADGQSDHFQDEIIRNVVSDIDNVFRFEAALFHILAHLRRLIGYAKENVFHIQHLHPFFY